MASHFSILRAYFKIVSKVQHNTYPNKQELLALFEEDPISERTLERHLHALNDEFGIKISYDRSRRGYALETEEDPGVDQFFKFMDFSQKANLTHDILKLGKEGFKYLDFEESGLLRGLQYLTPLFHATRNQKVVEIEYHKFYSDERQHHIIYPYLLKEYQNRWYIISYGVKEQDTRTYAIDRIRDLKVTEEKFTEKPMHDKLALLDHCIGLNWSSEKIERVVIRFSSYQAKYQRALPWHHSQKELDTAPKGFVDFEYRLIINYELQQKIWMLGKEVEVLEPQHFSDRF